MRIRATWSQPMHPVVIWISIFGAAAVLSLICRFVVWFGNMLSYHVGGSEKLYMVLICALPVALVARHSNPVEEK